MRTGRPREFDREAALETAMELFWEKGFEGTSKRDLLEASGLSSQSLYNAFGDKRALFMEALRYYLDTHLGRLLDALRADGSPLENLRCVIGCWGSASHKGCLMVNALAELGGRDEAITALLKGQATRVRRAFAETIDRAISTDELPTSTDGKAVAAALYAIGNGLSLMRRVGASRQSIDQTTEGALGLLEA